MKYARNARCDRCWYLVLGAVAGSDMPLESWGSSCSRVLGGKLDSDLVISDRGVVLAFAVLV